MAALARVDFFNHNSGAEEESDTESTSSKDHQDEKSEYVEQLESGEESEKLESDEESDSGGILDLEDSDGEVSK